MLGGPESLKYEISTSCYSNRVIGAPHGRCYVDSKYLLDCNDGLDKVAVSHWGVNTSIWWYYCSNCLQQSILFIKMVIDV